MDIGMEMDKKIFTQDANLFPNAVMEESNLWVVNKFPHFRN